MKLPLELKFLQDHLHEPKHYYQNANWLLTAFDDSKWIYDFDYKTPKAINWQVRLSNGSLLTDIENERLLRSLKSWLIASTLPHGGNGFSNSTSSQARAFFITINLIDLLLINDCYFQLHKFGLGALTEDDLKGILAKLCESSNYSDSLFDWTKSVVKFAQDILDQTKGSDLDNFFFSEKMTGIKEVTSEQEIEAKYFGVEVDLIPRLRAALSLQGFTIRNQKYGFIPDSLKISREIYRQSIRASSSNKPSISFLCYSDINEFHFKEYSAVPVTTGQRDAVSPNIFRAYQRSLYTLGILHELNLPAPSIDALVSMNSFRPNLQGLGRYRTLPSDIVFKTFRCAVELHFEHGREILNGFLRLAIFSRKKNCSLRDISDADLREILGPHLSAFGVRCLSLSKILGEKGWKLAKKDHFEALRGNQGLLELVRIYFGAVQMVVGALSARRGGELRDLRIDSATDISGGWIVFDNRKSTRSLMGLRSTEARPIEPVAVKMLQELERFHKVLNRIGFGPSSEYIFSTPGNFPYEGRSSTLISSYNRNFDLLCDYFETPVNSEGNRYYIRQHQLRRFFALLFFYSSSFGGLETLQWMLGHTDVSHVWHYITESMHGDVLRSAKSQYVAESLHRNDSENFKDLSVLIESRYGTTDFTLIDTDELEDYVSELLEEGDIEVEPEFFTDAEGEKFKVVVKLVERNEAEA